MPIEIKLPALGENIDSATVTKIMVKVGDTIKKDQPIAELDTEKASVDVPASASGTVKEIRVKEGDVVGIGQIVLILEESGGDGQQPAKKTEAEPPKPEPQKTEPPKSEPPQSASTEKNEAATAPSATPSKPPEILRTLPEPAPKGVPAAPSIRRMARQLGIDIHAVSGTGPDGRISEEDVRNYARSIILNASGPNVADETPLPDFSRWGEVERKPMSSIRRATAEHVSEAWSSIPHVTQFDTADITELEEMRGALAKSTESTGSKLTITAILLKVASAALEVFPQFNVSLDLLSGEIISKRYYHIGVAVDTEQGLFVPVIRDVDKKNLLDLSAELAQFAEKARNRKLALEDMQGGTFTITNLGGIGGVNFTPIINTPEVAILGVSRASHQPVLRDGEFKPRLILPLALSFDHRAVDGADAARFLRWIAQALEQPLRLL
jgi:pyruvate dehydrogenase E2 component (dihydrolipoyllysine-residue acetyltransferase)